MSPEGEFDLSTFCCAVERRDAATQLRYYASNAQVRLTSLQDPARLVQTLEGDDVEHWVKERCADREVTCECVCEWLEPDQVMMTEERHGPDGTLVLSASTVRVSSGLITDQSVVLIQAG